MPADRIKFKKLKFCTQTISSILMYRIAAEALVCWAKVGIAAATH